MIRNANTKEEFPSTANAECLPKNGYNMVAAPRPRKDSDKDTSAHEVSITWDGSIVSGVQKGMMEGTWVRDGFSESA